MADNNNSYSVTDIQNDINELKAYTKWLYKYGGTGGKGGSGSGDGSGTSKWSILVYFNNSTISNNSSIQLSPNDTQNTLKVQISRPGLRNYGMTLSIPELITVSNKKWNNISRTLNESNNWVYETTISPAEVQGKNITLNISVTDYEEYETKTFTAKLILYPLIYSSFFGYKLNNTIYQYQGDIYYNAETTNNIYNNGLYIKFNYEISDTGKKYLFRAKRNSTNFDLNSTYYDKIQIIDTGTVNAKGSLDVEIIEPGKAIDDTFNYGEYYITLEFGETISDNSADHPSFYSTVYEIPMSCYILPDGIFLKFYPSNNLPGEQLYAFSEMTDTRINNFKAECNDYDANYGKSDSSFAGFTNYVFNTGLINFDYIPYAGITNTFNHFNLDVTIIQYSLNGNTVEESSVNYTDVNRDERTKYSKQILFIDSGIYTIKVKLTNIDNTSSPEYNYSYNIYVHEIRKTELGFFDKLYKINNGVDLDLHGKLWDYLYYGNELRAGVNQYKDDNLYPALFNLNDMGDASHIVNTINSNKSTISINNQIDGDTISTVINFGLQYNIVNNTDNRLIRISSSTSASTTIDIYQNKVSFRLNETTAEANLYLKKEESYKYINDSQYHLLTLYIKKYPNSKNVDFIVYYDGVIEGVMNISSIDATKLSQFNVISFNDDTSNRANISVNLIDVTYLSNEYLDGSTVVNPILFNDFDIIYYFYNYCKTFNISNPFIYNSGSQNVNNDYLSYLRLIDTLFKENEYITNVIDDGTVQTTTAINMLSYEYSEKSVLDAIEQNSQGIIDLPKYINIPVLYLVYDCNKNAGVDGFTPWYAKLYGEGETDSNSKEIKKAYWANKDDFEFKEIDIPANINFLIKLQGSSTLTYKGKNFELILDNSSIDMSANKRYVFTPNFNTSNNIDKAKSFLPEESFTLKADVVDSAHANNTSIGLFVNKNTTKFKTAEPQDTGGYDYSQYQKNCLTGFPILLFIDLIDPALNNVTGSKNRIYCMGIYNFNLGRQSYFNLGYREINKLNSAKLCGGAVNKEYYEDSSRNKLSNNDGAFGIYEIPYDAITLKNSLIIAEIQGGSNYFDFSQFHESILFGLTQGSTTSKLRMFDDFVMADEGAAKSRIQTFVKDVAKAGYYLFKRIKKNFSDDGSPNILYGYADGQGYNASLNDPRESINQVPNAAHQLKMTSLEGDVTPVTSADGAYYDFNYEENAFNNILENLIRTVDKDNDPAHPMLDYHSLVEYYTICMVFGLVDSVMKNLNIKSWEAKNSEGIAHAKFYIAFYDMDTALGTNNQGDYVENFAFSDYWLSRRDEQGNLKQTVVYRDFYPKTANHSLNIPVGYDVPASYLFAIAKYVQVRYGYNDLTSLIGSGNSVWSYSPDMYYAFLRKNGGPLANAKSFINNYYANDLNQIPEVFVSLNYRQKYVVRTITSSSSDNIKVMEIDTNNSKKLKGRSINKVYDWLNTRLHILDLYFGLNTSSYMIQTYDKAANEWQDDTTLTNNYYWCLNNSVINNAITAQVGQNPDILVNKDITLYNNDGQYQNTQGRQMEAVNYIITLKALNLSPLSIKTSNNEKYYLLEKSSLPYTVQTPATTGSQMLLLGGSPFWVSLSSSDLLFYNGTFNCNAPYLEQIICRRLVTCNSWDLRTPSLKELILDNSSAQTSDNEIYYSGDISLTDEKYYNLTTVKLNRVDINLSLSKVGCTTVELINIGNRKIEPNLLNLTISGCKNISNFSMSNCKYEQAIIDGTNQSVVQITNNSIKTLSITSYYNNASLVISNDSALETLTVRGSFASINISGCKNLKYIYIHENCAAVLNEFIIIDSNTNGFIKISQEGKETIDYSQNPYKLIIDTFNDSTDNPNPISSEVSERFDPAIDEVTIDLSQFNNLSKISFAGTYGFNTITLIRGHEYSLVGAGLQNTDFTKFEYNTTGTNKASVILTVQNQTVSNFMNTNILPENVDLINFKLASNATSLSKMFMITNGNTERQKTPSLTVDFVNKFFDSIKDANGSWNNIYDVSQIFYGQTTISDSGDTFTNILAAHTKLSLGRFVNCVNARQAYNSTGVKKLTRNLFYYSPNENSSLGKNINADSEVTLNIDEIISPISAMTFMSTFALYDIINKIENFFYSSDNNAQQEFSIVIYPTKLSNNVESFNSEFNFNDYDYEVKNIFWFDETEHYPAKLKTLTRISFNYIATTTSIVTGSKYNISFENLFSSSDTIKMPVLEEICSCFNTSQSIISNINNCGLNNIETLKTIRNSFNLKETNFNHTTISTYEDDYINYAKIISWRKLYENGGDKLQIYKKSGNNVSAVTSFACSGTSDIIKYINQKDFEEVLEYINQSSDIIDYLFRNTIFVDDYDSIEVNNINIKNTFRCRQIPSSITLGGGRSNMLNITSAKYTFNNIWSLYDNSLHPIKLTQVSFYGMDLIDMEYMFEGNEISGEIPMNLFNKIKSDGKYENNIINLQYCLANLTKNGESNTWKNTDNIYGFNIEAYGESTTDIRSNYVQNVINGGDGWYTNYPISGGDIIINSEDNNQYTGLLLPPDLFYGCSTNSTTLCNIDYCCADSYFVGVMPNAMFNSNKTSEDLHSIKFESLFKNLRVLPRYYKDITKSISSTSPVINDTEHTYVFIPQNFIKLKNNLYKTFDFAILLPSGYTLDAYIRPDSPIREYDAYYFMYDNTIQLPDDPAYKFISDILPIVRNDSSFKYDVTNNTKYTSIIHLGLSIDSNSPNTVSIKNNITNTPIVDASFNFLSNSYDGIDMKQFIGREIQFGRMIDNVLANLLFGNIIKVYEGDITKQVYINYHSSADVDINNTNTYYMYYNTAINKSKGVEYPFIEIGTGSNNDVAWISKYLVLPAVDINRATTATMNNSDSDNNRYFIKYNVNQNTTKVIYDNQMLNNLIDYKPSGNDRADIENKFKQYRQVQNSQSRISVIEFNSEAYTIFSRS